MAHLFAGDAQQRPTPGVYFFLVLLWNLVGVFQRVCRVQVLHHEGVLDLSADMQQENRLVMRRQVWVMRG